MSRYSIEESSLSAIADKIREKKYIDNELTPAQMAEELDGMGLPFSIDEDDDYWREEPWVRPVEYPNLELIDLTDFDGVYLTYDLRKTPDYGWIGIYEERALNQPVYFERGHLDENNVFVVDEQYSLSASKQYFRQLLDSENGEIQLWRVWTNGHLTNIGFSVYTTTNAQNFYNQLQPCVERRGRLPYLVSAFSSPNDTRNGYNAFSTRWLLRDDIKDVVSIKNMCAAYSYAINLRELHFDGWDTSNVTTLSYCFQYCERLRYIPFHQLTTPKVNAMAYMCSDCNSLDNVDISHFDISKVTAINNAFTGCRALKTCIFPTNGGNGLLTAVSSMFLDCRSLEQLPTNLERLNVTNVGTFSYMFNMCRRLKSIDLSEWTVEKVTNLGNFASSCYGLEYVNLSGWDVSKVTTANSVFDSCRKLQKLVIDGWSLDSATTLVSFHSNNHCLLESDILTRINISTVTNLSNLYTQCYSLKTVLIGDNLEGENILTTTASMFNGCWSLEKIHMPNMHFTVPVTIDSMFSECHSLSDLDISAWHIDALRSISSLFNNCNQLKEVDISDWVVDDGNLTIKNSVNNMFNMMRSCKRIKVPFEVVITNGSMTYLFDNTNAEYIDISGMNLVGSSNVNVPNIAGSHLVDFYPPYLPAVAMKFDNDIMISHDSLVRILNRLPTLTSAKTITLGQSNRLKLTPEEIAIATNKGWTVT